MIEVKTNENMQNIHFWTAMVLDEKVTQSKLRDASLCYPESYWAIRVVPMAFKGFRHSAY